MRLFRRRFSYPDPVTIREYALTETELHDLATYNAEVSRGILHTARWKIRMAELQQRFNEASFPSQGAGA